MTINAQKNAWLYAQSP